MSEMANLEEQNAVVEGVGPTVTKLKRTVREFLKRDRAMGLPGAKKMRRRTRLEEAKYRDEVNKGMVRELLHTVGRYRKALLEFEKESNWICKEEENQEITIIWVGESDPLEIVKKAGLWEQS